MRDVNMRGECPCPVDSCSRSERWLQLPDSPAEESAQRGSGIRSASPTRSAAGNLALACLLGILVLNASLNAAVWLNPQSGDWFDATNWQGPVPNAAGEFVVLIGNESSDPQIQIALPAEATVGQLLFLGTSRFTLSGGGPLRFDNPGNLPASISVNTFPYVQRVDAPIAVADGQQLVIDAGSDLFLGGGIASTGGDILKRNSRTLTLQAPSPDWMGTLVVERGELRLEHTLALAAAADLEVRERGILTIASQRSTPEDSNDPYQIPLIRLNGATLRTNLGAAPESTDVETEIHLASDSTIRVSQNDNLILRGGMAGPGGISFLVRPDSSSFSNRNTLVEILGSTSYSGPTVIGPDMDVTFYNPEALGDSTADTRINRGSLNLMSGGSGERIHLDAGQLYLGASNENYGHEVFATAGNLFGGYNSDERATLTTKVHYEDGLKLGSESSFDDLVLSGGIDGRGSVLVQNGVAIENGLTSNGNLYVVERGNLALSGPLRLAGSTYINRTTVRLVDNVAAPEMEYYLTPTSETADASLIIESDNTVRKVVVDPRNSRREGTFNRAILQTVGDAVLTVTDELVFRGGTLEGAIRGQPLLTKEDRTTAILRNIAGSEFDRVDVEAGTLTVEGNAGDTPPAIHLGRHDTGRLFFTDVGDYRGDVYLNDQQGGSEDSSGFGREGGLNIWGDSLLNGNIDLGSRGATIAAGAGNEAGGIGAEASIHGGNLTFVGRAQIEVRGGNHTYGGVTRIFAEDVKLLDNGRLNSTAAVVGGGGGLTLDNSRSSSVPLPDRIPDATPIELRGMRLTLIGRPGETLKEQLSSVATGSGASQIIVSHLNSSQGATSLEIAALTRGSGGTVRFDLNDAASSIRFANPPQLDNGLIGGWATFGSDDFATYGPDGVVAYSSLHAYVTDLNSATAADNVALTGNSVSISSDKTINALKSNVERISLGGHTLTIDSGGMFNREFSPRTTIAAGHLTAGPTAGSELIVSGWYDIEADVVDNAAGPIGVTLSQNGDERALLTLRGHNTYTGPTIVNATQGRAILEIMTETAFPTGGDLIMNGGQLRIDHQPAQPLQLGHVELRHGADIVSASNDDPEIEPRSLTIESGSVRVAVAGSGAITKVGPLTASFSNHSLERHTGPITIEAGTLEMDVFSFAPVPDGPPPVLSIQSGGRLLTTSRIQLADRVIRFDGGVLETEGNEISAAIEVVTEGTIRTETPTLVTSPVTGSGRLILEGGLGASPLTFAGDLNAFQGDLLLTGDRIRLDGSNAAYTGRIHVAASGVDGTSGGFGSAEVIVLPAGTVSVGDSMETAVQLAGGTLQVSVPEYPQRENTFAGDLAVSGSSQLVLVGSGDLGRFAAVFTGDVELQDGSSLDVLDGNPDDAPRGVVFRADDWSLRGGLHVSGSTTVRSFENRVLILGTITPETSIASLNLEGNDTFALYASILLKDGNQLAIHENGGLRPLELVGGGRSLAGEGTLANDISLQGAVLSPGNSAGLLSVGGDLLLGADSIFRWDVSDPQGVPGIDWDLVAVAGVLGLQATTDDPWIFEVHAPAGRRLAGGTSWLVATAGAIEGFDPAALSIEVVGLPGPASITATQFVLYTDGGNLRLRYIPEPTTWALLFILAVFAPRPPCLHAKRTVSG